MLKLTYIETGFYLEYLAKSLEDWVQERVVLALRVGESLYIEPSTAAFLLPMDLPDLETLVMEIRRLDPESISLSAGDAEYIEVSLNGTWVSLNADSDEGVFVAAMSHSIEFFLLKLWQDSQVSASVLSE
ncbi:alr0857 family protein [Chlorogloea sp. CCALA 695]|uniref:alr0857 family protein n=1 Tax=Chlorogloea sp. CCALA 695 TaxID=2107693 RepID=UPI000D080E7A|nr:alr0857 family protein [Chlorogloea sp. CCALA 695]PSB28404.1 hypothetical protein C7B70_20970 [Chlorogloea sp. CCALA 695]